jgi:hypothetical protein
MPPSNSPRGSHEGAERKGSVIDQIREKVRSAPATGYLKCVAYIDGPRVANYSIALESDRLVVRLTIQGPNGPESEWNRLDAFTGKSRGHETHDKEFLHHRSIAAIYHALGMPPSYWEDHAKTAGDTQASWMRMGDMIRRRREGY